MLNPEEIKKSEYTATHVHQVLEELGFRISSALTWLNWIKNQHRLLYPSGSPLPKRRDNSVSDKGKQLRALYTFEDVCLAVWMRSVSCGRTQTGATTGVKVLIEDAIKTLPGIKKAMRNKKNTKTIFVSGWNSMIVDADLLMYSVTNAIYELEDRGEIQIKS